MTTISNSSEQPEENINEGFSSAELFSPTSINVRLNRGIAGQVASIRGSIDTSKTTEEHYLEAQSELERSDDPNDVIDSAVSAFRTDFLQTVNNTVMDALAEPDAVEFGVAANEVANNAVDILNEPDRLEIANIMSMTGDDNQLIAEQMFYQRKIAEMLDTSFWDKVVNFSGLLIPDWVIDTKDLTGVSLLEATPELQKWVINFQSLPKEERLKMFPYLQQIVLEAVDDNELKASIRLMQIIDPRKSGEVTTDAILDAVDWTLIGAPLIKTLATVGKTYNVIKNAEKLGDIEAAARVNAVNIADHTGSVAIDTGVDRAVSAANNTGFRFSELMPEATDGIAVTSNTVLDQISTVRALTQEKLAGVVDNRNFLRESALTPDEQLRVQNQAMDEIEELKNSYIEQFDWYVDDALITERTEDGFTVSYKLNGIEAKRNVKYVLDDVGEWHYLEAGPIETKLWSPSVWMDKIQSDAVDAATRIGFAQSRIVSDLRDSVRIATKHLGGQFTPKGRKSRKKLDFVLSSGDDALKGEGKVYTPHELMFEGIETEKGIIKLNPKEVASYYSIRDIFDSLHFMRNKITRDTLTFQKFKEVHIKGDLATDGLKFSVGRPFASASDIPASIKTDTFRVWSPLDGGKIDDLKNLKTDEMYDNGYSLVKFRKKEMIDDEFINYGFVKNTDITDLRHNVVNKKTGYVPRIHKDGFYFVKQATDAIIDGARISAKQGGNVRTLRLFDSRKSAEEYAESLRLKDADNKYLYEVKHDKQLSMAEREEEILNETGGLFTSSRSSRTLLYGLEGDIPRRTSAFSAMDRNLQNIANNMPMNEFRMGIQQRWLNSAKQYLSTPGDFNSALLTEPGTKLHTALAESREWIRDVMRIPTKDERRWESITRGMAEWMEGKSLLDSTLPLTKRASIRRGVMVLGTKDPFASMRSAAFHSLLGWFNPAQLFVQAQGASIAFSLDPLAAPNRIRQYMALRSSYFIRDNDEAVRKVAKAAGVDGDEFIKLMDDFDRTGLMQSVKTTADHGASASSTWMGADALRQTADKALVFFREGEMFNRGYAFLTARSSYMKRTGKKAIDLDDFDLKEIVALSFKKTLNLNRANRAHWQKGIWSIPTQFQQISAKFYENMAPNIFPGATKKFTAAEKSRIMVGQFALYGAAGIPLGEWVGNEMLGMAGYKPGEIPEGYAAFATDGFWGWAAQESFGVRVDVGQRGSLPSGVGIMFQNILSSESTITDAMLGAFGEVPNRAFRSLRVLGPMVVAGHETEWTLEDSITSISSVASIISTFGNAHKAWMWWKLGEVTDNKGRLLFDIDRNKDLNLVLTKAFGFTPSRITDFYDIKKFTTNKQTFEKETANALRILWRNYLSKDNITEEDRQNLRLRTKAVMIGLSPQQQISVRASVGKDIFGRKDPENTALLKALNKHIETEGDSTSGTVGLMFNSNLTKQDEEE